VASISEQVGDLVQKIAALATSNGEPVGPAASLREYTEHLDAMMGSLQEYNELSAEGDSSEQKPFSINECLQSIVDQLTPAIAAKGLALKVEIEKSFPEIVNGDGGSLGRIFLRLLKNAVRVSHTGEIGLTAGIENYRTTRASNLLYFHGTVSDCGINIAKQDMPSLFAPFHPTATGNNAADDLGLNLAICKALVQRAGGGIWVENKDEPAEGSTIHFNFPLVAV
jgi:signal transduction histidine kinase